MLEDMMMTVETLASPMMTTMVVIGMTIGWSVVLEVSKTWNNASNLMYVVGATKAEYLGEIRQIIPDSFLLVPGVGAQGGNLQDVCKYGMTKDIGLLINSSRGIIYAGSGKDFAVESSNKAKELQKQMEQILNLS